MIRELIQLDNQDVDPRKLGGRALGLMQGSLCSQCLTVSAAHFDGFFFFFSVLPLPPFWFPLLNDVLS